VVGYLKMTNSSKITYGWAVVPHELYSWIVEAATMGEDGEVMVHDLGCRFKSYLLPTEGIFIPNVDSSVGWTCPEACREAQALASQWRMEDE